jgi:hypothetical protein
LIEQEIAIATYIQRTETARFHTAFALPVGLEGIRSLFK